MSIKLQGKDLFPFLGDYGPISIYKGEQKLAGYKWAEKSGQELRFDNTYNSHVQVEVDGQSYQHADSGKNLFNLTKTTPHNASSVIKEGEWYVANSGRFAGIIFDKSQTIEGKTYTISFTYKTSNNLGWYTISNNLGEATPALYGSNAILNLTRDGKEHRHSITFTATNTEEISISLLRAYSNGSVSYKDIQMEEGSVATEYEEYKPSAPTPDYPIEIESVNNFDIVSSVERLSEVQLEEYDYDSEYENVDKINLNLGEPLRSVGDIKDRLFRDDSDGLWKVERNVEPVNPEDGTRTIEETYGVLDSPIYEVLPQDYQDKLNTLKSFKGSNYVYTVLPDDDLTPTIHAKTEVKDI